MEYPTKLFYFLIFITTACNNENKLNHTAEINEAALSTAINKTFSGAVPFSEYTDSLLFFLYAVHKISPDKILLGQST